MHTPGKQKISKPRHTPEVQLVLMPYMALEHPSLALGILHSALQAAGISAKTTCANLLFAEAIGLPTYRLIELSFRLPDTGEWTFAGAAFPGFNPDHSQYLQENAQAFLKRFVNLPQPSPEQTARIVDTFQRARSAAPAFIESLARRLVRGNPRIVACSSCFEQHVPSLALLRRVRELAPSVITILGGSNCEAEHGLATARSFPWVDFIFSGEADTAFPELCRALLRHGRRTPAAALPFGTITSKTAAHPATRSLPPRAVLRSLDDAPIPNYDDYFATLERSPLRANIRATLTVETSRGCWWGAKRHCSFCSRHPAGLPFRSKSPERVLFELDHLSSKYALDSFDVVDNAVDISAFRTWLPQLAARKKKFRFFCETKASLSRAQVRMLAKAGAAWLQPGIESLHDSMLALMQKGTTAAGNVAFLKHAREFGARLVWHMLVGAPNEQDEWHAETADWLPLIHHLQPPSTILPIAFLRFSPYFTNAAEHGLHLEPFQAQENIYPLPLQERAELASFFRDPGKPRPFLETWNIGRGLLKLIVAVRMWRNAQSRFVPPVLCQEDRGASIIIMDTRPCAPRRRVCLRGLAAAIYRACASPASEQNIIKRLSMAGQKSPDAAAIRKTINALLEKKLILKLNGRCLALAVPGDMPGYQPDNLYPGGAITGIDLYDLLDPTLNHGGTGHDPNSA